MLLIGLIGYKQSGKDTFADHLVAQYNFKKLAFADPVKQICKIMFLLDDAQLNDPTKKEVIDQRWKLTPRQMMQMLGTDMIRDNWGNDFWLRNMEHRLKDHQQQRVVISDVRFLNEADWIKEHNGVLIRITDDRQHSSDNHPSETEQLQIQEDLCIYNTKTGLAHFHHQINGLLQLLLV